MTVTVDQKWLNKASYPVIVDPTFGYTTLGGTNYSPGGQDLCRIKEATPASDGTVTQLSFGASVTTNTNFVGALYTAAGTLQTPQGDAAVAISSTKQFYNITFTSGPSIFSSTTYELIAMHDNAGNVLAAGDSGSSQPNYKTVAQGFTYPNWPSPLGTIGSSTVQFSIYVTYTESASSLVKDFLGSGFIPFAR